MIFQAICTANYYVFRAGSSLAQPSFIEGKIYTFEDKGLLSYNDEAIVSATNERGIESVMSKTYFTKYFKML